MKLIRIIQIVVLTILMGGAGISCKKFVTIDPPRTDLITVTVFTDNGTAEAAVVDLYANLTSSSNFSSGSQFAFSFAGSLASDVMIYNNTTSPDYFLPVNTNQLTATSPLPERYWNELYTAIYRCNSILEGLEKSSGVSEPLKSYLAGETRFIRAFYNFYLVNLYGDVPLVLTTDYQANNVATRATVINVYDQIVADLKEAQNLLPADYARYGNQRFRVNKSVATALLARTYLYRSEWALAETEASSVINNTLYTLEPNLALVFRGTSPEVLFQLWRSGVRPADAQLYASSSNGKLTTQFMSAFETGDQRRVAWVKTSGSNFLPNKYPFPSPSQDYSTIFRLAEMYLVRAEARAKQNKITGANSAASDLNSIRNRAGLGATTATTESAMLLAIEQERNVELFTEWGHRWLDLKRTGRAAAVLGPIKSNWQDYKLLWPIPQLQIDRDPNMAQAQNPGY